MLHSIYVSLQLVNKQKNAKKKQPSTLTEDMLNELNKNHMGGIDNYGADDLYNMEDVWNDRPYETKLPKKVTIKHNTYTMYNLCIIIMFIVILEICRFTS